MFVDVEDYETTVCNGRQIGHCIALAGFEGAERLLSGQETTFCLVVWHTADARVHLPLQRWTMEWVPMAACHPVETGDGCDHCVVARGRLAVQQPDSGQQGERA